MRARFLLLAAALAAFGGSLVGGFHLDDYAIFAGAGPRALAWPHPLTHLVDWMNDQAAGDAPMTYHALNLLLHLAAVLLAYECLRRLLPASAALFAAAIFAVHPLQAEVVDSVSARYAMVAAVLALAALLAALVRRQWMAWVLSALAIAEAAARPQSFTYALAALRFLRLFFVPWGFTIFPEVREPLWASAAVAIGILAMLVWRWQAPSARPAARAALIGLVLLMPGVPHYLAVLAFATAAGLVLAGADVQPARIAGITAVLILIAISVSRTYVWMSDERLWREAVRRAPQLVEPKIQLAKCLRAADALDLLNRARQQAPYHAGIPAAIGKVLLDDQQYEGAVDEFSRSVALDPKNALAFNNRGVALAALGQLPAATADFEHALALDPHLAEARENLKRVGVR